MWQLQVLFNTNLNKTNHEILSSSVFLLESNIAVEKMEMMWLFIFSCKLFSSFDRNNSYLLKLTVFNVLYPSSARSLSRQGYELCAYSISRDLYQWFNDETQLKRVNQQHKESKFAVWGCQHSRLMFTQLFRICSAADALLPEKSRWSKDRQHVFRLNELEE